MDNGISKKVIKVGSRKSKLALIQTEHVICLLQKLHPEIEFKIETMNTLGDKVLDIPLPKIGEKSLFTKELETALATNVVHFVVHSLKDLPTTLPDGMAIGAVLKREDPRDALVLQKDLKDLDLKTLPKGSVIGTSSLRRTAQLGRLYPHLLVEDIRGNLNTRLAKLDELGKFNAIILATAGLERMGWHNRISKILDTEELLYAVGQGALAVECKADNEEMIDLLSPLFDAETAIRIIVERTFLKTLGGGCSAPVAIATEIENVEGTKHKLTALGAVWSLDGKEEVKTSLDITFDLAKTQNIKTCPYKDKCNNICTNIDDYEDCNPSKKRKLNEVQNSSIPLELLKNDPHEHCPVTMPVGAEFMGKCPYFELQNKPAHHVDLKEGSNNSLDISKCPYLNNLDIVKASTSKNTLDIPKHYNDNNNKDPLLFCGLVPHKDVPLSVLKQAEVLGVDLAKVVIKHGALEIMSKAQNYIRSNS